MNRDNILNIFARLTQLDPDEVMPYSFLCDSARRYVASHIKEGADVSGYSGGMEFAAAALAFYRFLLWGLCGDSNIRIGEVQLEFSEREILKSAQQLCREAFDDLHDILITDDFVFERI